MSAKTNQVTNQVGSQAVVFEALEGRQMMSATHHHHHHASKPVVPLTTAPKVVVSVSPVINAPVTIAQTNGVLQITGTTGNDQILISQSGTTFTIKNGTWSKTVTGTFTKIVVKGNGGNDSIAIDPSVTESATLYGGAGSDTLTGNNGNDTFYAGTGTNVMKGGTGANVFVTLGSRGDTITGGQGNDSFWMDNATNEFVTDLTAAQNNAGRVHRIASFLGGVATTLGGQTFAEPALTDKSLTYKNFSNMPLFSNDGPSENDINQGYLGDCWYLSSLSSVAKADANKIRQSVVDLGDGTYAVQFTKSGKSVFVRVDGNLPTWSGGQVAYANVTNSKGTSALWVAIMEKAMAEFDGTTSNYNNINGGWMSTAYNSLGLNNGGIWASSAIDLVNQLSSALTAGEAVTIGIGNPPAGVPLIGDHAYTVDHLTRDAKGNVISVTLRNPWGVDGAGNDGNNDGYVTVTPAQLYAAEMGACTANA